MGKSLRDKCPRASHASWRRSANRHDPIVLLEQSSKGRIPQLIRSVYGRMMQSPFTWYRGAALNMTADLANTPATGLRVQACGDAHFSIAYADQSERDHEILMKAVRAGKLVVFIEKNDGTTIMTAAEFINMLVATSARDPGITVRLRKGRSCRLF